MTFKLKVDALNAMIKVSKGFTDPKSKRTGFKIAYGRLANDTLHVRMLNMYAFCDMKVPCIGEDGNELYFLLPDKKIKATEVVGYVTVTDTETSTCYNWGENEIALAKDPELDPFKSIWNCRLTYGVKASIVLSPALLATALKVFENDVPIRIDVFGDTEGVCITQRGLKGRVLPMKSKEAERWE